MAAVDLGNYLDDDALDVTVDGHVYRIPSPDAATGIRLTAMVNLGIAYAAGQDVGEKQAAGLKLDDEDERDFLLQVLGSAYAELQANGVSWVRIQRLGRYALLYFTLGPEAADEAARASSGEAAAPNRATRRATSSPGSSATATSSPSRGSTASTTSRKPSRSRVSAGKTSSASGT
jgi:hypothetical protein